MVGMVGGDFKGDRVYSGFRKGMVDSRSAADTLSPQVPVFASDTSLDGRICRASAFNIPVLGGDKALKSDGASCCCQRRNGRGRYCRWRPPQYLNFITLIAILIIVLIIVCYATTRGPPFPGVGYQGCRQGSLRCLPCSPRFLYGLGGQKRLNISQPPSIISLRP